MKNWNESFATNALMYPRAARTRTAEERETARRMVEKLMRGEDVRDGKVASMRAAFVGGQLDHAMRLDIAVDRLIEALAA